MLLVNVLMGVVDAPQPLNLRFATDDDASMRNTSSAFGGEHVVLDVEVDVVVAVLVVVVFVVVRVVLVFVRVVVVDVDVHVPHITGQRRRVSAAIARLTAVSSWQFCSCATLHPAGSMMPPQ